MCAIQKISLIKKTFMVSLTIRVACLPCTYSPFLLSLWLIVFEENNKKGETRFFPVI